MKKIKLIFVLIALLALANCGPKANLDEFARCLSDTEAEMYGAYTCPACQATKKRFGESFQYIEYIECHPRGPNPQLERCKQADLEITPVWVINGNQYKGYQTMEDLAEISGCPLQGYQTMEDLAEISGCPLQDQTSSINGCPV